MPVKTGQAAAGMFVTRDATGALTAATGTPAGALYLNGVANGASVSVSGSNPYKWSIAALPTLDEGDIVEMYITATISAVATGAVVWQDTGYSPLATGAIAAATFAAGAIDASAIAADAIGSSELAATAATEIANAVDVVLSAAHGSSSWQPGGAGAITFTYTVYESDGTTPVADCEVWVTTDEDGLNVVSSSQYSDAAGVTTWYLDAGTYYFWRRRSGDAVASSDTEVVA